MFLLNGLSSVSFTASSRLNQVAGRKGSPLAGASAPVSNSLASMARNKGTLHEEGEGAAFGFAESTSAGVSASYCSALLGGGDAQAAVNAGLATSVAGCAGGSSVGASVAKDVAALEQGMDAAGNGHGGSSASMAGYTGGASAGHAVFNKASSQGLERGMDATGNGYGGYSASVAGYTGGASTGHAVPNRASSQGRRTGVSIDGIGGVSAPLPGLNMLSPAGVSVSSYSTDDTRRDVAAADHGGEYFKALAAIKEAPEENCNSFAQLTSTFKWQSWNAKLGALFSPERVEMVMDILKGCHTFPRRSAGVLFG